MLWRIGGVVGLGCDESHLVELTDGRLMLKMRSTGNTHRRRVATSSDGGITWTPSTDDPALLDPVCQASLIRDRGTRTLLLFSTPASTKRERMIVRSSLDDGQAWSRGPVLPAGPAAYSCLTTLLDGTIGCLYECGDHSPYETLTFARFERTRVAQ
jgi:sialidase-1